MLTVREAQSISKFGKAKKVELEGIKAEFDKKEGPGLWWDSKPPENGNMFYWFSIFVTSKKENVMKEVQKYINIYEKIGNIDASSCDVIEGLSGELDKVFAEAQETKRATRSSTIHRMCRDFTSEGTKKK